jgi:hypothetical protein
MSSMISSNSIAVAAGEHDELSRPLHDRSPFGRARHRDAAPAAEFQDPFVTQQPQRTEDRVRVHPENRGEVLRGGRRSPGFASPSAIARRISPATCS